MKVLSLFDGISCGYVALQRVGVLIESYYASEIKPAALACSRENYPQIIHIGDIKKVHYWRGTLYTESGAFEIGEIDLVIGGSPCQNFSVARTSNKKTIDGLEGEQSPSGYILQRYTAYDNSGVYVRTRYNNTWYAWKAITLTTV